jgi:hypothetical protein
MDYSFGGVLDSTRASGTGGVNRHVGAGSLDIEIHFNIAQCTRATIDLGSDTEGSLDGILHGGVRVGASWSDVGLGQGSVQIVLSAKGKDLGQVIRHIFILSVRRAIARRSQGRNTCSYADDDWY